MDWNHYNGPQMTPEQIHAYLDRIACPGPILKRIRPRAQGRAYRINKRTSHITLVLKEKE